MCVCKGLYVCVYEGVVVSACVFVGGECVCVRVFVGALWWGWGGVGEGGEGIG